MKKIFFLITFVVFFICLISPLFVFAAEPVKFCAQVTIPGFDLFTKDKCTSISASSIADTAAGMYKFIAGIAGIAAVIVMMAGGYIWLFAGGNASKVGEAKSLIGSAVLGLFLVLGSYTILNLINPELIKLKSLDDIGKVGAISVGVKGVSEICTSGARNEMIGKLIVEKKISDASQVKCGFMGEYKPGSECMDVYCPGQSGNQGTTDICLITSNAEGKYIRGNCVSSFTPVQDPDDDTVWHEVFTNKYPDNKKCGEITYIKQGGSRIGQICDPNYTDPNFNSCYFINQEKKDMKIFFYSGTNDQPSTIVYKLQGFHNGESSYPTCRKN